MLFTATEYRCLELHSVVATGTIRKLQKLMQADELLLHLTAAGPQNARVMPKLGLHNIFNAIIS